jgi:hypothetical protein
LLIAFLETTADLMGTKDFVKELDNKLTGNADKKN